MQIAVSTWALHREIGAAYWNSPALDTFEPNVHGSGVCDIFSLVPKISEHGYERIELCHFHLSSRDDAYLRDVGQAIRGSGLVLQTLLIDDGNLTDPEAGARDRDWIQRWIEAANVLGAEGARVIAGKNPWTDETFERSATFLSELAGMGVRIRIENWFDLLRTPDHVLRLLDRLGGKVGLCVDFGNWSQPSKYADLALIARRAQTCHAKAEFRTPSTLEEDDFQKCLEACTQAHYQGPYVLVNGGSLPTEWEALDIQRDFILAKAASV